MELVSQYIGSFRKHSVSDLANATMRMTKPEAQQWFSLMLLASTYLEWGTGGSTIMAAWRSMQSHLPPLQIDTVDSSRQWFEDLKSRNRVVAEAEAAGKLRFHLGDLGRTVEWGKPADWGKRPLDLRASQAESYVGAVNASKCCYDLILVDGRFRVACALHALRLAHDRTVVIIHDSHRYIAANVPAELRDDDTSSGQKAVNAHYHVVLRADSLAVLRPKAHALARARSGDPRFEELLAKAKHDPLRL